MTDIYVVDLETTGLRGGPLDVVVDIGICKFDTNTMKIEDVYSSHLGYKTDEWTHRQNSWIFTHEGAELTVDDVNVDKGCPPAEDVIKEVKEILQGQWVTSYNIQFDLDRFLLREPWWINCKKAPDIMAVASSYMLTHFDDHHRPSLQKSYDWILEGKDLADIGGLEKHLGLPDARMAAYLLRKLWYVGMYRVYKPSSERMFG